MLVIPVIPVILATQVDLMGGLPAELGVVGVALVARVGDLHGEEGLLVLGAAVRVEVPGDLA